MTAAQQANTIVNGLLAKIYAKAGDREICSSALVPHILGTDPVHIEIDPLDYVTDRSNMDLDRKPFGTIILSDEAEPFFWGLCSARGTLDQVVAFLERFLTSDQNLFEPDGWAGPWKDPQ